MGKIGSIHGLGFAQKHRYMYVLSRDYPNFISFFYLPVVRHEHVAKVFLGKKYQHFPALPVFTQGLLILLEETRQIQGVPKVRSSTL